jgi:hypothetical protein
VRVALHRVNGVSDSTISAKTLGGELVLSKERLDRYASGVPLDYCSFIFVYRTRDYPNLETEHRE